MSFGHLLFKKGNCEKYSFFKIPISCKMMKIQHQKIHWYVYSCNVQSFYLNLNHSLLPLNLARSFSHNNLDFEGISCTTSCPHKLHDREPMLAFMNRDVWMYKYPGAYSKEFGELLPISFSLSQTLEQEQCKLADGLHASFQIQTNNYLNATFSLTSVVYT